MMSFVHVHIPWKHFKVEKAARQKRAMPRAQFRRATHMHKWMSGIAGRYYAPRELTRGEESAAYSRHLMGIQMLPAQVTWNYRGHADLLITMNTMDNSPVPQKRRAKSHFDRIAHRGERLGLKTARDPDPHPVNRIKSRLRAAAQNKKTSARVAIAKEKYRQEHLKEPTP